MTPSAKNSFSGSVRFWKWLLTKGRVFSSILLSVTEVSDRDQTERPCAGDLGPLILKTLALEPMHGWAIAQRIRQISGEVLRLGQVNPSIHFQWT